MGVVPGRDLAGGDRETGRVQQEVRLPPASCSAPTGSAHAAQAKLVRRAPATGLPTVTDGPYQETKEYIASFYLLDVESEERALEIAADMPFADQEPVELWPVPHESKSDV